MVIEDGHPGQRVLRFEWTPPDPNMEMLPIKKYIVQIFDPKFGRHLNIATLEPDYYESEKRFLSIEELNFYRMEETQMGKLSHCFSERTIELQIAAANDSGTGLWQQFKGTVPTKAKPKKTLDHGIGNSATGNKFG